MNDEILLELKVVESFSNFHGTQVFNHLKATGLKLGLLINFDRERGEYKRLVFFTFVSVRAIRG